MSALPKTLEIMLDYGSVRSRGNFSGKIGKIAFFLLLTILGTITKKSSFFEVLIA